MFSAHLVFGDIDKSSNLDFPQRVEKLRRFWKICQEHRPYNEEENKYSFYDIDNDCFMAGFSSVPELINGIEVLKWVIKLQKELFENDIEATFGVNLLSCQREVNWKRYPGLIYDSNMIFAEDLLSSDNDVRINRPKLIGDSLIVVSRLLSLGKKVRAKIVFSVVKSGHIDGEVEKEVGKIKGITCSRLCKEAYYVLDKEQANWLLKEPSVKAWVINYNNISK